MSERKSRLVCYEHIAKHICSLQYIDTYSLYDFFFFGAKMLGREPTFEELFKDTHFKAKNKVFID